jgi:short-subunit dehydrogenase
VPIGEWERILSLNLMSVVRSNAVWLPKLLARGRGHIVNTASFAGLFPYATSRMPYVASKAAVIALSESLALYLHPQGIRVSCLCPGPVMTGVADGMKQWSAKAVMQGPGSNLTVLRAEQVAVTLADGMAAGRVIIPSHDEAWEIMRRHAADPDAYIQAKIEAVASGDFGRPKMPETPHA